MIKEGIAVNFKNTFPALANENFRYFWLGQCISFLGTWMQRAAQQWLVYTITKSALLLGVLGVAQFSPILLFSLFAGVFVDRYPKKKIILITQTALMLQSFLLALLVWTGHVRYWQVLFLATIMGLANTLDMPARQSFFIDLVGKKDLTNAIALNSAIVNLARITGPTIAALLMANFGASFCFLFNAVSFIPAIIGLNLAKPITNDSNSIPKKQENVFASIIEGLKYILSKPILLIAVAVMLAVGTFAMNMEVIFPVFADKALHKGVHGYGFLLSANGLGSLAGSFWMAARSKMGPSIKYLFISSLILSLLLITINFIHFYILTLIISAVLGFSSIIFMMTVNSTIQLNTNNRYRGRIMSVYTLAFAGTTPLGNLFAGSITEKYGPGIGFLMCGAVTGILVLFIMIISLIGLKRDQLED
ncbi:major facilitator superfamily MFS_1 [Desulfofarcimen acetoxidans DSM 771]|jgi:MFS family permease|uniref:Major facilitator superfamily MFS_1 n=1 Tax=Desulfofarcimen acetoxidans (strain ATCC 49208 / DSM 771 / KCTC 5769 / VKM B-1644 / 5575) TaxID=485916 RepID=C8VWB9_DESAS|nr:MFS transporter [Desulfofarcimen acetoxidans]ACV62471.1 major facilitator superfamily MFS_1 [Desulfofarcimen acetoxidans DSM 771]